MKARKHRNSNSNRGRDGKGGGNEEKEDAYLALIVSCFCRPHGIKNVIIAANSSSTSCQKNFKNFDYEVAMSQKSINSRDQGLKTP